MWRGMLVHIGSADNGQASWPVRKQRMLKYETMCCIMLEHIVFADFGQAEWLPRKG